MSERFTDLRLNTGSGGNEEGFWPSFTDIMTVIVMIFLMAMLILLLKNMDLVQRLQATLAAERAAKEEVITTSSLNRDLQLKLQRTQTQLDMLRMQLMDMSEERDRLRGVLAQTRDALEQEQSGRQQEHSLRMQEQAARAVLEARLRQATVQITSLSEQRRKQGEQLAALEQERHLTASRLASLQGEFTSLKLKYDKLVRPARTARGKYVVKVRLLRRGGQLQRFIRSPEQNHFVAVDESGLTQQLDDLHATHPDDMYVRIIFPDDSGLSYSEAWKMTESLLKKYDYYYRDTLARPLDSSSGK